MKDLVAELQKQNEQLTKQLEAMEKRMDAEVALASALAGKAKSIAQLRALARSENAIRPDGFYFRGESGLTASEYVKRLEQSKDYGHHFRSYEAAVVSVPKDKNPWRKGSINLTEQMRITKQNPALAKDLKEAAKV